MPYGFRAAVVLVTPLLACACSLLVSTGGLTETESNGDDGGTSSRLSEDAATTTPAEDSSAGTGALDSGTTSPPDTGNGLGTQPPPGDDAGNGSVDAGSRPDASGGHSVDSGAPHKDAGGPDTAACAGDLSNLGAGDFTIAFSMRMTQAGLVALLNQRAACSSGVFWDLRLSSGELTFEANDGTNDATVTGSGPNLDDGSTHAITVSRVSGIVTLTVDSNSAGTGEASASFGELAPLATGSDVCDGTGGLAAFAGSFSDVCVTAL